MGHHLLTKFRVGHLEFCPCQTVLQQECPLHDYLRCQFWPAETGGEEAFQQPGRPTVQNSFRAENRSFHLSDRQEKRKTNRSSGDSALLGDKP